MKDKNVILGFTGGIGHAAAKALLHRNEKVTAAARNIQKAEKYSQDLKGIELAGGDASSPEELDRILSDDVKTLFYCVNIPYPQWEEKAVKLLSVSIEACINNNVKLVFPGNVYVYGLAKYNPVNEKHPYAAHTKKGKIRIEMETMLKEASEKRGLKYTITRFPDFYGPYVVNGFSEKIFINAMQGKTLNWIGDFNIPIEYIFIEDAGEAMAEAALSDKSDGKVFNVPAYSETTSQKFLGEVSKQGGQGSKVKGLNSDFIFNIVGLFTPVVKELKEMLYLKRTKLLLDGTLYKETFGSIPATPYEEGISKTLDWVKHFIKFN